MEGDMEITENVRVKAVDILDELTDILAEIGEREYNQQKTWFINNDGDYNKGLSWYKFDSRWRRIYRYIRPKLWLLKLWRAG